MSTLLNASDFADAVADSIDWSAVVREAQQHARFRLEVLARARVHRAEERALEDAGEPFVYPRCDVCGERGTDNDPAVDLYDPRAGTYVVLAHFEGGCRERLPEFLSDFDPRPGHGGPIVIGHADG